MTEYKAKFSPKIIPQKKGGYLLYKFLQELILWGIFSITWFSQQRTSQGKHISLKQSLKNVRIK